MSKTIHFKSKGDYSRWLKWGYSHDQHGNLVKNTHRKNVFKAVPGESKIFIAGKKYSPKKEI